MSIQTIELFFTAIIALTGIALIFSLWFHRQAILLQKSSLQASMFSEISGRISHIMGKIPEKTADESLFYNWYIRLFNEFESLIFLSSHKCLSSPMRDFFQNFIIEYIDDFEENYPQIQNEFANFPTSTFCNLREFYEKTKGKKSPF